MKNIIGSVVFSFPILIFAQQDAYYMQLRQNAALINPSLVSMYNKYQVTINRHTQTRGLEDWSNCFYANNLPISSNLISANFPDYLSFAASMPIHYKKNKLRV